MFIGITGNSGSGQTTVAEVFERLGARVCSLDETGHRLMERRQVRSALAKSFCRPEFEHFSGAEIRRQLSDSIFLEQELLTLLESVLHPVMIRWAGLCRSVLDDRPGIWVLEGALLFELGLERHADTVILVSDSLNRVQERLIDRDRIDPEIVLARWAHQWSLSRKRHLADIVVDNSGTLEELTEKAERLYISLTETETGHLLNDQSRNCDRHRDTRNSGSHQKLRRCRERSHG